jgi:AraC family transcriptional regulator
LLNRDPQRPLSAVALQAGYADQAHMTREFARLAGRSPARLRGQQLL